MLEILKSKLSACKNNEEKYHQLREYLQLKILHIIDLQGYFRQIAFVGGTALRIIYQLKRFSEDLDFCLINKEGYDFEKIMQHIEKQFLLENIDVSTKYKHTKAVASGHIKFNNLLHILSLSQHHDQVVLIKFEVDQNPPNGYQTEFSMINDEFLMSICHYDLSSLFAGKLHALLFRKYAKGRDFYDLIWYMSKKVKPNYTMLNTAIEQTQGENIQLNNKKLYYLLKKRIEEIDFVALRKDIEAFLMDPTEIRFFDRDFFLDLIKSLN